MDARRGLRRGGARGTVGDARVVGICGGAGVGDDVGDLGGDGGVWASVAACRYVSAGVLIFDEGAVVGVDGRVMMMSSRWLSARGVERKENGGRVFGGRKMVGDVCGWLSLAGEVGIWRALVGEVCSGSMAVETDGWRAMTGDFMVFSMTVEIGGW